MCRVCLRVRELPAAFPEPKWIPDAPINSSDYPRPWMEFQSHLESNSALMYENRLIHLCKIPLTLPFAVSNDEARNFPVILFTVFIRTSP